MNRLNQLMQQHADSGARSDIECYAEPADPKKLGDWYIPKSSDPEMQQSIDDAVEYLTLRGLIARHPDHDWVMVNIAQPIIFNEVTTDAEIARLKSLESSIKYLLDNCPHTVRSNYKMAGENLEGSISITFLGMQNMLNERPTSAKIAAVQTGNLFEQPAPAQSTPVFKSANTENEFAKPSEAIARALEISRAGNAAIESRESGE